MGVELALVTPEEAPLGLFGTRASEAIRELLEARGIALRVQTTPLSFKEGVLRLAPAGQIETAATVALPRLEGPRPPATSAPSWERPTRPLTPSPSGGRRRRSSAGASLPSSPRSWDCRTRHRGQAAEDVSVEVEVEVELSPRDQTPSPDG